MGAGEKGSHQHMHWQTGILCIVADGGLGAGSHLPKNTVWLTGSAKANIKPVN